jgi:hypothetical protein
VHASTAREKTWRYANSTTSERLRRELVAYLPRHHDIDLFSTFGPDAQMIGIHEGAAS